MFLGGFCVLSEPAAQGQRARENPGKAAQPNPREATGEWKAECTAGFIRHLF